MYPEVTSINRLNINLQQTQQAKASLVIAISSSGVGTLNSAKFSTKADTNSVITVLNPGMPHAPE